LSTTRPKPDSDTGASFEVKLCPSAALAKRNSVCSFEVEDLRMAKAAVNIAAAELVVAEEEAEEEVGVDNEGEEVAEAVEGENPAAKARRLGKALS